MDEKFPYGYDVNAYIDKAFEQMKTDFPWATRDMIAEHTNCGIEKVGDDYQYVNYWSNSEGKLAATGIWRFTGFGSMIWGAILPMFRPATAQQAGRGRSSFLLLISSCLGKSFWISTSIWFPQAPST